MQSKAATVEQYLAELPADRRQAIAAVRELIRKNIEKGFQEGMQYGMIGYTVPHSAYPAGYHCDPKQALPFVCLASQKNHMALYLMCVYEQDGKESWFHKAWAKTGKKLDMGKSCLRFKKVDDLALDVLAELFKRMTVKKYIELYETCIKKMVERPTKGKPKAATKTKQAARPAAKKKAKPAKKAARSAK
jgi:hypothetical protein